MIARILFAAIMIILILPPLSAFAQSDSVTTAMHAADALHTEAISIVKELQAGTATKDFESGSDVVFKKTNSRLKALRTAMEPSERRHRQSVDIFKKYCDAQIGLLKPLAEKSGKEYAEKLIAHEAMLRKMCDEKLDAVKDSLKSETYRAIKPTPMPETNRPPYEKENEKRGGVYDR